MTSGLVVLSPVVTEATVGADLLETLEVLTKLVVEDVGHHLGGLAVLDVTPVQEPVGDLVLARILHDRHQLLDLLLVELTSPPGQECVLYKVAHTIQYNTRSTLQH